MNITCGLLADAHVIFSHITALAYLITFITMLSVKHKTPGYIAMTYWIGLSAVYWIGISLARIILGYTGPSILVSFIGQMIFFQAPVLILLSIIQVKKIQNDIADD